MESLPLKKLDCGLQKPTGPSSGVVASIVLIIIALSSVSFFFLHNSHTFQIVLGELQDTCTSNHFKNILKNQNCCCSKNHKKSKLGHKVIIFISCERSCVTLHSKWLFFLISILLSSYLDFCEKFFCKLKIKLKNNEVRYGKNNHSLLPPVITLQVPLISS